MQSRDEFQHLVSLQQPKELFFYAQHSEAKRVEMFSLLCATGIAHMSGWKCLDTGPGYGDSLDIWHELGASECAFIERDPWLFTHNRLKSFAYGWNGNHIFKLNKLPEDHYDFIWCRGGISHEASYFYLTHSVGFKHWLSLVERSAAKGAHIIVSPYREAYWMNQVFEKAGYFRLPYIEGHTSKLYPETWYKRAL